jgi:hypothetical protein
MVLGKTSLKLVLLHETNISHGDGDSDGARRIHESGVAHDDQLQYGLVLSM